MGLAQILYEWNDLAGAERQLLRGLYLGEDCGAQEIMLPGYIMLARLRQAQGEAEVATQALGQAAAIAPTEISFLPTVPPGELADSDFIGPGRGGGWCLLGRFLKIPLDASDLSNYRFEESYLTLARVRIAQGRVEEALKLLDRLLLAAESGGREGRVIEIQMLRVLALQAGGDATQAMIPLGQALTPASTTCPGPVNRIACHRSAVRLV